MSEQPAGLGAQGTEQEEQEHHQEAAGLGRGEEAEETGQGGQVMLPVQAAM